LQQHKYAKEHAADVLRRRINFELPSRAFASSECACNEMLPLKTKHFPPGLFTTGSYVRIRTGEPIQGFENKGTGERCASANRMRIQSDAIVDERFAYTPTKYDSEA
jgi:hypothetical protein